MSTPLPLSSASISPFLDHPDFLAVSSFVTGLAALLSFSFLITTADLPRRIWNSLEQRIRAGLTDPEIESRDGTGELGLRGEKVRERVEDGTSASNPEGRQAALGSKESKVAKLIKLGPKSLNLGLHTSVLVSSLGRFGTLLAFDGGNSTGEFSRSLHVP